MLVIIFISSYFMLFELHNNKKKPVMDAYVESYARGFTKGKAFLCFTWHLWIKKKGLSIIIAVFLYFKQMD